MIDETNAASELPLDYRGGCGRIKLGTRIFQDHHFGKWPSCLPPRSEYCEGNYEYEAREPKMLFEMRWTGNHWECKADGYGMLRSIGDVGEYGNGCIIVLDPNGIELVTPNNEVTGAPTTGVNKGVEL